MIGVDKNKIFIMGNTQYAKFLKFLSCFFIVVSFFVGFFFSSLSDAQQVEISSSLNPVGSGARAVGMGGAFISVADDATAASWNPAGLVQLEKPEVSIVYSYFGRQQSYSSTVHPEIDSHNSMNSGGINYSSAAYPFVLLNRNMIVSVNYQRLYEMDKHVKYRLDRTANDLSLSENIDFKQKGYLYALSPAFAVQVSPKLYLGATLNLWGDYLGGNGWQNSQTIHGTGVVSGIGMTENYNERDKVSFKGINAHFGLLWMFHPKFTLGVVFKTPFDADLGIERDAHSIIDPFSPPPGSSMHSSEKLTMKMPASYGFGISYRHSDVWTVALDVYRTEWSHFLIRDSYGNEINPIDTKPISEGRLKDTTQVRIGTEYLFVKDKNVIPLRFGLFYDPEPQKGTFDNYYGFSLGTGYATGKVAIDVAYQCRIGRNLKGDLSYIEGVKADITQHAVMMSVIYYFDKGL